MEQKHPGLMGLAIKTIITHTTTYFLMGVLAYTLLNYPAAFARPDMVCWMRPIGDPVVGAGVFFQPIRGLVFALVFYPLRDVLFGKKNGWLLMWWMLVGLGILSTFGPAPGSFEGLVFTRIPILEQLRGYLEIIPQALLLSVIVCYWVNHPEKKWLSWVMGAIFLIALLLITLGLLVG